MKNVELRNELSKLLIIDKTLLDDAIEHQADVFHRVSLEAAQATSEKDFLKRELEEIKAEEAEKLRLAQAAKGQKIVETRIAQEVLVTSEYMKAVDRLSDARNDEAQWLALKESFHQRSYMLRELAGLYVAGYWGSQSSHIGGKKEK